MRKRLVALSAILLLAASVWAGDPWKDKPYTQWDEKDVKKVLFDSPWAKEVIVTAKWRSGKGGGGSGSGGGGGRDSSGPANVSSGNTGYGPPGGVTARTTDMEQEAATAEVPFVVRWASARTVREAMARNAMMHGMSEADAAKFASETLETYVIVILGNDMTPFAKTAEDALKSKTHLKMKKSKTELVPIKVELQRPKDSPKIVGAAFYFVKKSESGEPTIAADEKGMEFVCEVGGVTIKTNFDPSKMATAKGADF